MIDIEVHGDLLILLRANLFLLPLLCTFYFFWRRKSENRILVGSLFSFLYSLALLLPAHTLAIRLGMWSYGSETLKLLGMPADLWFAGSFLFGPATFLAFPKVNPWFFTAIFISLQVLLLKSLDPLVIAGDYWILGVILVFLFVHTPAMYLARWTSSDINLAQRAILLAFAYGSLAFFIVPTLIMHAMGGSWGLDYWPTAKIIAMASLLLPCIILGLSAVHMFVVYGEGTPIPLDRTKHLVTSGLYSYITNPMQLCTAASWVVIGIFLQNVFIALAAGMAVVFVMGLVRWHHRNDLLVRFPDGWPEYKSNVPEWLPRWKPWFKGKSKLYWDTECPWHSTYIGWLKKRKPIGISLIEHRHAGALYQDSRSGLSFNSAEAFIYPLFHINFIYALLASGLLLLLLPLNALHQSPSNTESYAENDPS
ncbi:methyltransferase family protein [Microbulbifer sp. SSSA002]|uniref:methyltransferase family protein n=1 Tax=Microbulbifer sp. SSSA002 TaxID=3243376 RepID=UPI00403951CE